MCRCPPHTKNVENRHEARQGARWPGATRSESRGAGADLTASGGGGAGAQRQRVTWGTRTRAAGMVYTNTPSTWWMTALFLRRPSWSSPPRSVQLHADYSTGVPGRAWAWPHCRAAALAVGPVVDPLLTLICFVLAPPQTLFSFRPPLEDVRCDEMYEQFYENAQVTLCC